MTHLIPRIVISALMMLSLTLPSWSTSSVCQDSDCYLKSKVVFDLNACISDLVQGTNLDYSEFVGVIMNDDQCSEIALLEPTLYRENPETNGHSCTPGILNSPGMCIPADDVCAYTPNTARPFVIEFSIDPSDELETYFQGFTFHERAPLLYNILNGGSGLNNLPRYYAVRILKNGTEIFRQSDIETTQGWSLENFEFLGMDDFEVTALSNFRIELSAYCFIGNESDVHVWDIDQVEIVSACLKDIDGGDLTGGPYTFCTGDDDQDFITNFELSNQVGENNQWLITNPEGEILSLPNFPGLIDFNTADLGTCLLWNLTYDGNIFGLQVGSLVNDLQGCYSLSNSIAIDRVKPESGTLLGSDITFCLSDQLLDSLLAVNIINNVGASGTFILTNDQNLILDLNQSPVDISFEGYESGTCYLSFISYQDGINGLSIGEHLNSIDGCFEISNQISITKQTPNAGTLSGGPLEVCQGDGTIDKLDNISLSGSSGTSSAFVLVNDNRDIVQIKTELANIYLENINETNCSLIHISYESIAGLAVHSSIDDLQGCFDLSNEIRIMKKRVDGGRLTANPFIFCLNDNVPDVISEVQLLGAKGALNQYVLTDADGMILDFAENPDNIDVAFLSAGTCSLWHISYESSLTGLLIGNSVSNLAGCYDLSNSIAVTKQIMHGGTLSGGPYEFCTNDGIADRLTETNLSDNIGSKQSYIITDEQGVIIEFASSIDHINFEGTPSGTCLIYSMSYESGITGATIGQNVLNIDGCVDLSNAVTVNRNFIAGGNITGGPYEFCVGDGLTDNLTDLSLSGALGDNTQWIITDPSLNILDIPADIDQVDFESSDNGVCLIWHIGYTEGLSGLSVGMNVSNLDGCFDISNSITVTRRKVNGGVLVGDDLDFCTGNGQSDIILGITLEDSYGLNKDYVITDNLGNIITVMNRPQDYNLDVLPNGVCFLWHISYSDELVGLRAGNHVTDLSGCFDFSNSITITKNGYSAGTIIGGPYEFCVGNGMPDVINDLAVEDDLGPQSSFIVTSPDGNIITIVSDISTVDFDNADGGLCLVYHLSHDDSISGLTTGSNIRNLSGCFDLSTPVEVVRIEPIGGTLSGNDIDICVGDKMEDIIDDIVLSGAQGTNATYLVTLENGEILMLADAPSDFDLDDFNAGVCLLWHLSYEDDLIGAAIGQNANDLVGCFNLSNPITINKNHPNGGILIGCTQEFCVGDNEDDIIDDVTLESASGPNNELVITDENGIIITFPNSIDATNFDDTDPGTCYLWHLSYEDGLQGLIVGSDLLQDLKGCYGLSNAIAIFRTDASVCANECSKFETSVLFDFNECESYSTNGSAHDYSEFTGKVINQNECAEISVIGDHLYRNNPNLNGHSCAPGVFYSPGMCVMSSTNCDYRPNHSKSIYIDLEIKPGTTPNSILEGISFYEKAPQEFQFIGGASTINNAPQYYSIKIFKNGEEVYFEKDIPTSSEWSQEYFDFSDNDAFQIQETCTITIELAAYCPTQNGSLYFIWDIDELEIITSCAAETLVGGDLFNVNGTPFLDLCFGDDEEDDFEIILENQVGPNHSWVLVSDMGDIVAIPTGPPFDFSTLELDTCFLWNIAYEDNFMGLEVGNTIGDLTGCFDFSNPIFIQKAKVAGGSISINESTSLDICIGDEMSNILNITLNGHEGNESAWIVTDQNNAILNVVDDISSLDFEAAGRGICLIWHISYSGEIEGLTNNSNISDIDGCYDLSNSIQLNRNEPIGGFLDGGPYVFCVDDGVSDMIDDLSLTNHSGSNSQFIVTDDSGNILGLPNDFSSVDFDAVESGRCLIWHLSYEDGLTGLAIDANINNITGCYDFSNDIEVIRRATNGGVLSGGPYVFCVSDGTSDNVTDLELSNALGANSQYVITDSDGLIIGLPLDITDVDFDVAESGTCLIWHLSYEDDLDGLSLNSNVSDLLGCYDFSNSIEVIRNETDGGIITGGPYSFCVGDGVADNITDLQIQDAEGSSSQIVITNPDGFIVGLPNEIADVNFDEAGFGICLIWHLSYTGEISGLIVDQNVSELIGCYDFSNSITVTRNTAEGGTLIGGPYVICAGDGDDDFITDISLSDDTIGDHSQWVITDPTGDIIGLPTDITQVNFDEAGAGECLIWYLSYQGDITGLAIDLNVADLEGCYDFSNSISVNRAQPLAGTLSGGPFNFCVGDGVVDNVSDVAITDAAGANSQFIITDPDGNIIGLPEQIESVDFDLAVSGTCLIWHLSYQDISGLAIGQSASDLTGCFALSNSITVNRESADGGLLIGGPYDFCVGDGASDLLTGLSLSGATGSNSDYVITDNTGLVLAIPNDIDAFDFDGAGDGICLVWHLSYADGLSGLEVNQNVSALSGCFDFSNSIEINRRSTDGGILTGGPFDFCVGDGLPDFVSGLSLSGSEGTNSQYVITDDAGEILGLPADINNLDFDGQNPGICLIWHLSYETGISGLAIGQNANDLSGCFDLSNALQVNRVNSIGGVLSGGPFEFCVTDGVADNVSGITLDGSFGQNSQYIITNEDGDIIGLPSDPAEVNFDVAGLGVCFIWHLSYQNGLTGLSINTNLQDLQGCFGLSNSIRVDRIRPEGGNLLGGPFEFCIDDQESDFISNLNLNGNDGANGTYILTNDEGVILNVSNDPSLIDFEGSQAGVCLLWFVSYEDGITGLEIDQNVNDLSGCFDLSNSISITRLAGADCPNACLAQGGTLVGDDISFCVGDGTADILDNVSVINNQGTNSQYLITSNTGEIVGLPADLTEVNFDVQDAGICLVWHLSYETGITGLAIGQNANDLSGCFSLSNSITVNRLKPTSGVLTGGPFTFCVGDGVVDNASGVSITGNQGANTQYIITDDTGVIQGLPGDIASVDFDEAGAGVCLIWHLSYEGEIDGLSIGQNANQIQGCFALSNSITVNRISTNGGSLTGGPYSICVDEQSDFISDLLLSNNMGSNSQYVITDDSGVIIGLPSDIASVDFNAAGTGVCLIWHLSYEDGLSGLAINNNVSALDGCFSFSNSVTVNRTQPIAGTLVGGPFNFCVGDGVADLLTGILVMDNAGSNNQYIITDGNGQILALPDDINTFDFDNSSAGVCLLWNISYENDLVGLTLGANTADLSGCFGLTNSITINRSNPIGGTLSGGPYSFCVGDNDADIIEDLLLSGQSGTNEQLIVTNLTGSIIALPASIGDIDFNNSPAGTCLIWNISYEDGLLGLAIDQNTNQLEGCFSLSNSIEVSRTTGDDCNTTCPADGGTIAGGPYSFCVGDDQDDFITDLAVSDGLGTNQQWIITDQDGVIQALENDISNYSFNDTQDGVCVVLNIAFEDDSDGIAVGQNINNISGCFDFSNSINVTKVSGQDCPNTCLAEGGTLSGGPFEFCVGDGTVDSVTGISLSGNQGTTTQYLITNTTGEILVLPSDLVGFDFDNTETGTCLIWSISYDDAISGLTVGQNVNDLNGCFDLSTNSIEVVRIASEICNPMCTADGGTLSGGPFEFCVGDGAADNVSNISLSLNQGATTQYIVTSNTGVILSLPSNIEDVNFDNTLAGTCLIWSISYDGELSGLSIGQNTTGLAGCFDLSNSIEVVKSNSNICNPTCAVDGGILAGGPYTFCVGDGVADNISGLTLNSDVGANSQYIVTAENGNILSLPNDPVDVNFDNAGVGNCSLYHLSFDGEVLGLAVGQNISGFSGCFDLSDPIQISRSRAVAGSISLASGDTDITVCVSDGFADNISLDLVGNIGASTWIVTDVENNFIDFSSSPPFDFEGIAVGTCLIYHVTSSGSLDGLSAGNNLSDLSGCFDVSNPITVNKVAEGPECVAECLLLGGSLTDIQGNTSIEVCVGNGISDAFTVSLGGNTGISNWVITDSDSIVIDIQSGPPFDFENFAPGSCLIWNVSSDRNLDNDDLNQKITRLSGCTSPSNALVVTKVVNGASCSVQCSVSGGMLTALGGNTELDICSGDGAADEVLVSLSNNEGTGGWVIADVNGMIISLPTGPPFDFENAPTGICQLWHISSAGSIAGLTVGQDVDNITGCYDLSNPITVNRTRVEGGDISIGTGITEVTICAGDGFSDAFDVNVENQEGNSLWVITDTNGNILDTPMSLPFDLESAGEGVCLIWHIASNGIINGLSQGLNVAGLDGCFDLSNAITVNRTGVDGGVISLFGGATDIEICANEGFDDLVGVDLNDNIGDGRWVITDENNIIISLPVGPPFNFEDAPTGTCLIWHLSSSGNLTGLSEGVNINVIGGCFDFSNAISVTRNRVAGGDISIGDGLTEIDICSGDGLSDAFTVNINDAEGASTWLITDQAGNILDTPTGPPFDLESAGEGVCLIWHLSSVGDISGVAQGLNVAGLQGCFDLSNSITVTRNGVNGGAIDLFGNVTEVELCAGDGFDDFIGVNLSDNIGVTNWVITDENGLILDLPTAPPFNFEGANTGVCLIWHLSSNGDLVGLAEGLNVSNLDGCFDFSNSIRVVRNGVNGGQISTASGLTELELCVGDVISDEFNVILENEDGTGIWLITDQDGNIIELPTGPPFDFENQGSGVCVIYHLSSFGDITEIEEGLNINAIAGCYSLSNAITVTRNAVNGGVLTTLDGLTELDICADDGLSDAFLVSLDGNIAANDWVITDPTGMILRLPLGPPFDLEGFPTGTCLIYNLSSIGNISGVNIGSDIDDIQGCHHFSNPITINKFEGENCPDPCPALGGTLSLTGGSMTMDLCLVAGSNTIVNLQLVSNMGEDSTLVVTNSSGEILIITDNFNIDLGDQTVGSCTIRNLETIGEITGLVVGGTLDDVEGCFALSNVVTINKINVDGGSISTADDAVQMTYCLTDGSSTILDVQISDAIGSNQALIVTNASGEILMLSNSTNIDFADVDLGSCFVYNLSYENAIGGLGIGSDLDDLSGCFDLSNAIEVNRIGASSGSISFVGTSSDTLTFCTSDNINDLVNIDLVDHIGSSQWLVTDQDGLVTTISNTQNFNFEGSAADTCLIWHLSLPTDAQGLITGDNISSIPDCSALSNSLKIVKLTEGGLCFVCEVEGGSIQLASGELTTDICVGEGEDDLINITLSNDSGTQDWVITDQDSLIINLAASPPFNFEDTGAGTSLIWSVSSDGDAFAPMVGDKVTALEGCYDLSNAIEVNKFSDGEICFDCQVESGLITLSNGTSATTVCVGDLDADDIDVVLTGNSGASTWMITSLDSTILELPQAPPFSFNNQTVGTCLIWHISFDSGLFSGLATNNHLTDIAGCFELSLPITVNKVDMGDLCNFPCLAEGGTISLDDGSTNLSICSGDGVADNINVNLTGNVENGTWVITDSDNNVLSLPSAPPFSFEGLSDNCLIWHLSTADANAGLSIGSSLSTLQGCFDLSNSISIDKDFISGGNLNLQGVTGSICVNDGVSDVVVPNLFGASGFSRYLLTTADGTITNIGINPPFDFEGTGAGNISITHISSSGIVGGLTIGANLNTLTGCFELSNSVDISKVDSGLSCETNCTVDGGVISGGPFSFCANDGIPDGVANQITLTNDQGLLSQWIVTNDDGFVFRIVNNINNLDFDGLSITDAYIWHISSDGSLDGLEIASNLSTDLSGCYNLSNALPVALNAPNGGVINETPIEVCGTDNTANPLSNADVNLINNVGQFSGWVLAQSDSVIVSVNNSISGVDLNDLDSGSYLLQHISFYGGLPSGLIAGNKFTNILGCFDYSNSKRILVAPVAGGTISGGPFTFSCIGDGSSDIIGLGNITSTGAEGTNQTWAITDDQGEILALTDNPETFNFDNTGLAANNIQLISFLQGTTGISVGNNVNMDIVGCFDISNSISITKDDGSVTGGTLIGGPFNFTCIGDNSIDNLSANDVMLSGNTGTAQRYLVVESTGTILGIFNSVANIDFNPFPIGTCFLQSISFQSDLVGLTVGNRINTNLSGCFALSNQIIITKSGVDGGIIETNSGDNSITICAGDGLSDSFSVNLGDFSGPNQDWMVTDATGNIIDLPSSNSFDFDNESSGTFNVYNISYDDVTGLIVGQNVNNLFGCFDLSNPIVVNVLTGSGCVGEVVLNEIMSSDFVELKNIGFGSVDVSGFFLVNGGSEDLIGNLDINCGDDYILDPGELLTVELSDVFINGNTGELALYISNNIANSMDMIDYVHWGSSSHGLTNIAIFSNNWTSGDFVPAWDSESISFDGNGDTSADWSETDESRCGENSLIGTEAEELLFKVAPNPGSNNITISKISQDINDGVMILYDSYGRVVMNEYLQMDKGEIHQMDISSLNDGNYYLMITNGNMSKSVLISKITQ